MHLFSNSYVYLKWIFKIYVFMCKLRSIFEVDFLKNAFLFKLRSVLEVYFVSKKSRSINEVLSKYKQGTFLFFSVFILLFLKLGFTPLKAEQPLRGMELQEKEAKQRLKHTGDLFKKNLQLKDVC